MTDLAKLRELLEKATKGNWAVHKDNAVIVPEAHLLRPLGGHSDPAIDLARYAQEICAMFHPSRRPTGETRANAELIAALRNEAPTLLDEVEALRIRINKSDAIMLKLAEQSGHEIAAKYMAEYGDSPHNEVIDKSGNEVNALRTKLAEAEHMRHRSRLGVVSWPRREGRRYANGRRGSSRFFSSAPDQSRKQNSFHCLNTVLH